MFVAGIDAHATYSVIAIVSNTGRLVHGPARITQKARQAVLPRMAVNEPQPAPRYRDHGDELEPSGSAEEPPAIPQGEWDPSDDSRERTLVARYCRASTEGQPLTAL